MNRNNRNAALDYLRAFAILFVMIFHYEVYYGVPEWLEPIARFGWTGVDLFFVLSGYLISRMLLMEYQSSKSINFLKFYTNRSLRILPVFVFVVGLYFLFPALIEGRGLQPLWRFLTFTQNLPIDLRTNSFSHAWSLCVEEHFYVLFPMILLFVCSLKPSSRIAWLFIGVLLAGVAVRYISWAEFVEPAFGRQKIGAGLKWIYYPSYNRLDGLLFGVITAVITLYRPAFSQVVSRNKTLLTATGFALLGVGWGIVDGKILTPAFFDWAPTLFVFPLVSLGYACLVLVAVNSKMSSTTLMARLAFHVATWSYSTYLIHKIVNKMVNTHLTEIVELGPDVRFVLSLVLAVFAGAILFYAVEKPFLAIRSKLNKRWFLTEHKISGQAQI